MSEIKNIILIPRGNDYSTQIIPSLDGETEYILQANDTIYFSVATTPLAEKIVLTKTLTADNYVDGQLILNLVPEDTINLQEFTYCFDVAIKFGDTNKFYTFIRPEESKFIITGAISHPVQDGD